MKSTQPFLNIGQVIKSLYFFCGGGGSRIVPIDHLFPVNPSHHKQSSF